MVWGSKRTGAAGVRWGSGQWAGEQGVVSDQLATTEAAGDATEVDGAALGEPRMPGGAASHAGKGK